ncbi:unnamed protein product [Rhizophagus irregularis]|nr:unnamed protein product [Rhizophagus irregularis]CAB5162993.1 unnamed protein product [Rhizophagus irregularis]
MVKYLDIFANEALLKDLPFRAFLFPLGKLNIWVLGIGKSNNNEWNFAGTGYKTSFIYTYRKKRCVFVQELEDDYCQVTIYLGNKICNIYVDNNPELVWKEVAILQQYEGKELFGLENNKIQQLVLSTPSCTLEKWNDDDVMRSIHIILDDIFQQLSTGNCYLMIGALKHLL